MPPESPGAGPTSSRDQPPLAPGFLAALPLFLAYELGLAWAAPGAPRASAEALVARSLRIFGPYEPEARLALLAGGAALAWVSARGHGLPRRLLRQWGEGLIAGLALGPLLFGLSRWMGVQRLTDSGPAPRSLASFLQLAGAAPWEELLFRVGGYGLLFLITFRTLCWAGLARGLSRASADLAALLGSAFLFALFHLDPVQRALGARGEPFHSGVFLWRISAGILLGGLFRWRGLGVSAWAHAVFNAGIALGVEAT